MSSRSNGFFFRGPGRLSEIWCYMYGLPSWPLQPFGMIRCITMASSFTGVKECTKTLHVFENYLGACKNPFRESLYSVFFSQRKMQNHAPPHATSGWFFCKHIFFERFFLEQKWPCDWYFVWLGPMWVAPPSSSHLVSPDLGVGGSVRVVRGTGRCIYEHLYIVG